MKKAVLFLLLLVPFFAGAQTLSKPYPYGLLAPRLKATEHLGIPVKDTVINFVVNATNGDTLGALVYKQISADSFGVFIRGPKRFDRIDAGAISVPNIILDSARRSNDTLYFRTTDGSEIAVKMEGIEIAGVNGLQDSLSARYTKTQSDGLFIPASQKAAADGVATLGSNGKIPSSQIPALAISETFVVASQAAMLALTAETGDVAVRTDLSKSFILTAEPASTLANWQELLTPTAPVQSVNGQTGNVNLTTTNISEGTNLYWTNARGDARYPQLSGSYANPSWLTSLAWSKITGAPTSFPTSSNLQEVTVNGKTTNRSLQITGATGTPAPAAGLELAYDGAASDVLSYNRATSTFLPLNLRSSLTNNIGRMLVNGASDDGSSAVQISGKLSIRNPVDGNAIIQLQSAVNSVYNIKQVGSLLKIGASGDPINIVNTGNVGIGTETPSTRLEVNGTITAPVLQSPSGDNLVLLANSASTGAQVTLTTDGLGIGGMPGGTHTARLLVAGNAVANDAWVLDNSAGLMGEFFIDGSSGMGIRTISNHPLSFYANDQKRIEIRANGVIHTTAGVSSHARLVSTATAFTIQPQDYVVIMEGMGTAAGDGVLITLPDPSTNGGRLLEFHEYSASSWATNYDIYRPLLSPLTTISGVMVIRAVNGKWRLISQL